MSRLALVVFVVLRPHEHAAVDEWTQQFVPGRSSDPRDWMADVIGASLGAILFLVGRLLWKSKSSTAT